MIVEKTDGTIRSYPVTGINGIAFIDEVPVAVREEQMMQKVLSSFALYQNFPNPFNPSTTIQYSVPHAGDVEVNIYDTQVRLVHLLSKTFEQTGTHSVIWDSRSGSGCMVTSGTYFCQVLFNGSSLVKKLMLIK